MTVETSERKTNFAGGQGTLVFTWKASTAHPEYIKVKETLIATGEETDLTYGVDYTVAIESDGVGGTVTVNPTYSTAYTQTVYRETTATQTSDYDDYNQFPADTLEGSLDILTMLIQELSETMTRSLTYAISSTGSTVTLPVPSANQFIAWNAAGDNLENKYIPDPSTLVKASSAEAEAGTNDTHYMTPAMTQMHFAYWQYEWATKSQAEAGTNIITLMSPLRVAQAIAALGQSLDAASEAEAEAGVENTKYMTALRVFQAIAVTENKFKVGREAKTLSDASGDVSYTGVGFKPSAVILLGVYQSGAVMYSVGAQAEAGAANGWCAAMYNSIYLTTNASLFINTGSTNYQSAYVKSFDDDGFTLTWTKVNSPTGQGYFIYLAIR